MFIFSAVAYCGSVNEQLQKALDCYRAEDYSGSIREYEIIISNKFYNPYVYYNLSNAYYKKNDFGRASLNVERALRLAPRDKNIKYNRNIMAKLAQEPEQNFAESFIGKIEMLASLNELTVAVSILFVILCIAGGVYCLSGKKIFLKLSVFAVVLFAVFLSLLYAKIKSEIVEKQAVVLYTTQVRNNPIKTEDASFEVLAGRKVLILSELGRWVNVKLSVDGLSGWIDKNSIEKI